MKKITTYKHLPWGGYAKLKPIRRTNFTYQIAVEFTLNKLNKGLIPQGFTDTQHFQRWWNKQPNYIRVCLLDHQAWLSKLSNNGSIRQ